MLERPGWYHPFKELLLLVLAAYTLIDFNIRHLVASCTLQHPFPSLLTHHPFVIAYTFDLGPHPYHISTLISTAKPFAASAPRSFGSHRTLGSAHLVLQLQHCWQQLEVYRRVMKLPCLSQGGFQSLSPFLPDSAHSHLGCCLLKQVMSRLLLCRTWCHLVFPWASHRSFYARL